MVFIIEVDFIELVRMAASVLECDWAVVGSPRRREHGCMLRGKPAPVPSRDSFKDLNMAKKVPRLEFVTIALSKKLQIYSSDMAYGAKAVPNHSIVSSFLQIRLPRAYSRPSNKHATHSSIVHEISNMWLLQLNATA